jgi:hypothetical protein
MCSGAAAAVAMVMIKKNPGRDEREAGKYEPELREFTHITLIISPTFRR